MAVLKWMLRQIDDLFLVIAFLLVVGFLADPKILGVWTWILLLVGCAIAVVVVVVKIVKGRRKLAEERKESGQSKRSSPTPPLP